MLILFFLIFISTAFPQDSFEIGNFNNANSFYISPSGFIFVTDLNEHKVYKIDTLGNILKETGGFGWEEGTFDNPVDIYATALNVYVTDKNNHRIQWFDKDLNFISLLQTRGGGELYDFGYPVSASVTNQGDLILIDSENNRLLKFDMFGNFLMEFGGLDAGKFRIKKPLSMTVLNNITYVLDSRGKRIVVFDQFGSGLNIIPLEITANNISSSEGKITLINNKEIYLLDLTSFHVKGITNPVDSIFKDIFFFNNRLYLLTPEKIIISSRN